MTNFWKSWLTLWCLGGALLALLPAIAHAQTPEQITRGPLPDLELGYEASQGPQSIEEYVPIGETVEDWSRMVTVQHMRNVTAQGLTAPAFIVRMQSLFASSCRGATSSDFRQFDDNGAIAAQMRANCPLNPQTQQPETTFFRAISGPADLHVVQVAFRHVPDEAETAWALEYLETVHLCPSDTDGPCP
jgi:hypothetical protein